MALQSHIALLTAQGRIEIELFLDQAPVSARAFLAAVREGIWEGGAFFRTVRAELDRRVSPISVVQARAAKAARTNVPHEPTSVTGLRHENGSVSLARGAPGTGSGASFFICVGAQPQLDAGGSRQADGQGFAVFGQVRRGMDVVRQIHAGSVSLDCLNFPRETLVEPVPILGSIELG